MNHDNEKDEYFFIWILWALFLGFLLGSFFFPYLVNAQTVEWSQLSRTQYNQSSATGLQSGSRIIISTSTIENIVDSGLYPIVLSWRSQNSPSSIGPSVTSDVAFIQNGVVIATTSPQNICFMLSNQDTNYGTCPVVTFPSDLVLDPDYHLQIAGIFYNGSICNNCLTGHYKTGGTSEIQWLRSGVLTPISRVTLYTLPLSTSSSSSESSLNVTVADMVTESTCTQLEATTTCSFEHAFPHEMIFYGILGFLTTFAILIFYFKRRTQV